MNGRSFGIGELELVSLATLRERAAAVPSPGQPNRHWIATGDVRQMHAWPQNRGALFQVASQFNLLEMTGPGVAPENGVGIYENDHTQGPACAIAAGAATIYRNYFASVGGVPGQTRTRQLDGFAELGDAIARALRLPAKSLWRMENGYALFTREGLDAMSGYVADCDDTGRDALRRLLRIGLHWDVEVTDAAASPGPLVSQAFCSALPVAYCQLGPGAQWAPLATLVLEAAYEATLWAAVLNAHRSSSSTVLLTMVGGGAFGNDSAWIRSAITRAVGAVRDRGLDIVIVSRDEPPVSLSRWWEGLQ